MKSKQERNDVIGVQAVAALERKQMEAYYCQTKEQALAKAISLIPTGSTVAWGGSITLNEVGILDHVENGDYCCINRDRARDQEEKHKLSVEALSADVYMTSANAVSLDGALVNMDGLGNRVAALIFGPTSVIVIVGINKVVFTEAHAIERTRTIAAPTNGIRVNKMRGGSTPTPCIVTGTCQNCTAPQCICSHLVITRMCNPPQRIKVIVVGEDLGY